MSRLATFKRKLITLNDNLEKLDGHIKDAKDRGLGDKTPTLVAAACRRQDITTQITAITRQVKQLESVQNAA